MICILLLTKVVRKGRDGVDLELIHKAASVVKAELLKLDLVQGLKPGTRDRR